MTNKDLAAEIEQTVRNLREEVTAWKSLATEDCSPRDIARLEREILDDVSQLRSSAEYLAHVREFQQALDRASGDSLIQRLHEEVLRGSAI
jgi:hypothetical protein